jgi:hypothetical protein
MKKLIPFLVVALVLFIYSCSPVILNSYIPQGVKPAPLKKILVWAMYKNPAQERIFENSFAQFLQSRGVKCMTAMAILDPSKKYEMTSLEKKFDSLGIDGICIISYLGTQKQANYVPPQTEVYPDYYGYYSWYYPMGYEVVTTGGYWTTTTFVNLAGKLYTNSDNKLVWTSQITIQDPNYIDDGARDIAAKVFTDWVNDGFIDKKAFY